MTGRRGVVARAADLTLASRPGRVLAAGRFRCEETGGGELVVTWELDDGRPGGEVRLPVPLYALVKAAAAGEKVSFSAVARAMRS